MTTTDELAELDEAGVQDRLYREREEREARAQAIERALERLGTDGCPIGEIDLEC